MMNHALPGADLIEAGIKDLRENRETNPAPVEHVVQGLIE